MKPSGKELKNKFNWECDTYKEALIEPQLLVVAVKVPSGAIETIINTSEIFSKMDYYRNSYDESFKLKSCDAIQIVGFMLY